MKQFFSILYGLSVFIIYLLIVAYVCPIIWYLVKALRFLKDDPTDTIDSWKEAHMKVFNTWKQVAVVACILLQYIAFLGGIGGKILSPQAPWVIVYLFVFVGSYLLYDTIIPKVQPRWMLYGGGILIVISRFILPSA